MDDSCVAPFTQDCFGHTEYFILHMGARISFAIYYLSRMLLKIRWELLEFVNTFLAKTLLTVLILLIHEWGEEGADMIKYSAWKFTRTNTNIYCIKNSSYPFFFHGGFVILVFHWYCRSPVCSVCTLKCLQILILYTFHLMLPTVRLQVSFHLNYWDFSSPKFQSDFVSLSSSFIFFTDIFFILQFLVFEFLQCLVMPLILLSFKVCVFVCVSAHTHSCGSQKATVNLLNWSHRQRWASQSEW